MLVIGSASKHFSDSDEVIAATTSAFALQFEVEKRNSVDLLSSPPPKVYDVVLDFRTSIEFANGGVSALQVFTDVYSKLLRPG